VGNGADDVGCKSSLQCDILVVVCPLAEGCPVSGTYQGGRLVKPWSKGRLKPEQRSECRSAFISPWSPVNGNKLAMYAVATVCSRRIGNDIRLSVYRRPCRRGGLHMSWRRSKCLIIYPSVSV